MKKKKVNKVDIKYIGIPNICFSLTSKDDKREKKYIKQRQNLGFDISETWSLYSTIVSFTLPRLKEFRKKTIGYPGNLHDMEEWYDILDKIILALEIINTSEHETPETELIIKEGLDLFRYWFFALWW